VPGLVAAYGFEETTGTTATNNAGPNHTGTLNGPTRTADGRFGRALSFDGTNDRVDIPDHNALDLTTGMPLQAWVRPTTNTGWRTALIKERGNNGHIYALYSSNGNTPIAETFTGGNYRGATAPNPLTLNTWTHLTTTYDGTTLRLYLNGTQVSSTPTTGSLENTNGALRIGGHSVWGEYFAGLIDEVRIYNRALTPTEIQTDMNTPIQQ
jgi:Laminin G domain.